MENAAFEEEISYLSPIRDLNDKVEGNRFGTNCTKSIFSYKNSTTQKVEMQSRKDKNFKFQNLSKIMHMLVIHKNSAETVSEKF